MGNHQKEETTTSKMIKRYHIWIILIAAAILTSCTSVVIKVDHIPANTPMGEPLYITGNFNNWEPGDQRYQLEMASDSNYYIEIPPGYGWLEYKFSRGDWKTVEKGMCGEEISNRMFLTGSADSIAASILSWQDRDPVDCPKVTLIIDQIPNNTPEYDILALASSLNNWDPDNHSIFTENENGQYYLTLYRPEKGTSIDCKVTRGSMQTSESDGFGGEIQNRRISFGISDTIYLNIQGWLDLSSEDQGEVVLIIDQLPERTPKQESIYLAGNINSWSTSNRNYQFRKLDDGRMIFKMPARDYGLEYKITRGGWFNAEVNMGGSDRENRYTDLSQSDTILISIDGWKDIQPKNTDELTIILNALPETTPDNANIYLSGNFNHWEAGKLRYRFEPYRYGRYIISIPRLGGVLQFRVSRGSGSSFQIKADGTDLPVHTYNYADTDTIQLDIEAWQDLPSTQTEIITLVVDRLPAVGPTEESLFLAPDFNGWRPGDKELKFVKFSDGKHYLNLRPKRKAMEYKITRGKWSTVEVSKEGEEIPNRSLHFGFADTVFLEVAKWRDYEGNY